MNQRRMGRDGSFMLDEGRVEGQETNAICFSSSADVEHVR